jgi:lipopolysaccharide export system ATP-binding protein
MITPDSGQVLLHGKDISNHPMYKRAQLGMGYLSQEPSIFTRLTVEQNLLAILETTALRRRERKVRCAELLDQFGLTKTRKQEARTLSGGERRKLEIARSLVTSPTIILLDEPFSGVDPITVESLQQEILRLREERRISILLTDHNVRDTLKVTDRSYILHEGKVFREGTPSALINDEKVRAVYLGHSFARDELSAEATPAARNP